MDIQLTEEQEMLRNSVQRLLREQYDFDTRRKIVATEQGWCRMQWDRFAEMGLLAAPLPEEFGGLGGNIVEVHHQRLFHDTSVKRAELDVVVETQNRRHVVTIIDALVAAGFPTRLLSSSEDAAEPSPAGFTG